MTTITLLNGRKLAFSESDGVPFLFMHGLPSDVVRAARKASLRP